MVAAESLLARSWRAGVGPVVGVPLGLVAGRAAWRLVVASHGLLDAPAAPVLALVVVAPVSVLLALAVSWWPAVTANRRPAQALRSE